LTTDRPRPAAPAAGGTDELAALTTESVRPELSEIDLMEVGDLVELMAADARRVPEAVLAAAAVIAAAVTDIAGRLAAGGRVVYVGAGSAGRMGVLDASELGPTFDVPSGVVEAVMAGGDTALRHAVEGAEDNAAAGRQAVADLQTGAGDVVVGISASGRTPFVVGALVEGRARGAATVSISCNAGSPIAALADYPIETIVGGEVIAGSSRMNAGTAQKLVLNIISTAAMVQLGKTFGNLMVDLRPTNSKLRDRAVRIVQAVAAVSPERAREALEQAGWSTKLACLLALRGLSAEGGRRALAAAGGKLRLAAGALAGPGSGGTGGTGAVEATHLRPTGGGRWRRLGVGAALVDGRLVPGDVAVDGAVLAAVGLPGQGTGLAIPGLVDLQVNGYAGIDAAHAGPEEMGAMAAALARHGVLAFQPTLISGEPAATAAAVGQIAVAAERAAPGTATVLGVHLEGPFLAPGRSGAHPIERLALPDIRLARSLVSKGHVSMVTLAPELPGALALVAELRRLGVVVSLGHTLATAAEAQAAVDAGASAVTHLFNGMGGVSARSPGLAGLALSDTRLRAQIIADGVHVADEVVVTAFRAAAGRCSLVTDATSLAGSQGLVVGPAVLGEVPLVPVGRAAHRPDGALAGGATTLMDAVRRLASTSLALPEVLAAATEKPALVIGRDDVGHLRAGAPADVVVLDDDLSVRAVLVRGLPLDLG
jgi:N-acetylmuramic acid 6-phosphate etherase/N-acetylglucosamine-6-phosphate deacetylase